MYRVPCRPLLLTVITLAFALETSFAQDPVPPPPFKHRIVVMTDIGGNPDDIQSMVRFMLYTCDFEIEGFTTGLGHGHTQKTRPELIRQCIEAYGKVWPNLKKHRADYPAPDHLLNLIQDGRGKGMHEVGPGMDSEASEWIIRILDRDDPRPVWFSIWGGPRELSQAIWKVSKTRSKEAAAAFKKKIRVHSIQDQDKTATWVKQHHPDVFWIFSKDLFRGIWKYGHQDIVSPAWLEKHVRTGHGPLGPVYPQNAAGKKGVKEGDTPSYFYLFPDGLSDPEHPEWGNWGGRFRPARGAEFLPAKDDYNGRPDIYYTVHRWREAYQNAFEARMDWCVKDFAGANHEPIAVCNGDRGRKVIPLKADPETNIKLNAKGSMDPDGDALTYRWWVYREAGSYRSALTPKPTNAMQTVLSIPKDASGQTIHVILEVTDQGSPKLTAYRRVILNVTGKPLYQPAKKPDPAKPITKLEGPGADWTFYRGVNVNGPTTTIDGHAWDGDHTAGFICKDKPLMNNSVTLKPPTDPARKAMIGAFKWNRDSANLKMTDVPKATYAVYAYVWEETTPTHFNLFLNGELVVRDYNSGHAGTWQRLGPWITEVKNGQIHVEAKGGDANFSGLEVWKKK